MEITSRYSIAIEDINKKSNENIYKLIHGGEEAYNEQVRTLADIIKAQNKKMVLITGPSSSGKTTSSYKLKKMLYKNNIKAQVINMDNFFKDLSTVPLKENGKPDMEGIVALDVQKLRSCLNDLLKNGETKLPIFDFATHKPLKKTKKCVINKEEIIILEGIHALNPKIIKGFNKNDIIKVYVHCNTNFTFKDTTLFFARELRLLRRLVRDERERQASYEETLNMWQDVCEGEDKNIRPFKEQADFNLNTTHFYEPLLYKNLLLKRFLSIKNNEIIKGFVEKFKACSIIDENFIPKDSLIREFIGD